MKICFVHVDFFFHKEAYNSIAVPVFFFPMFFTDIWLQNDYLVEKYPERYWFPNSRETRGSCFNWWERVASFSVGWNTLVEFSQIIFAMKVSRMSLSRQWFFAHKLVDCLIVASDVLRVPFSEWVFNRTYLIPYIELKPMRMAINLCQFFGKKVEFSKISPFL